MPVRSAGPTGSASVCPVAPQAGYHWRFGPRATNRRNIDYYFWGWSNPENVPWSYQLQDGGGVLGFSYHDLIVNWRSVIIEVHPAMPHTKKANSYESCGPAALPGKPL